MIVVQVQNSSCFSSSISIIFNCSMRTRVTHNPRCPALQKQTLLLDEELEVLREQYLKEQPQVQAQTKFDYAWGLVRSAKRANQELGVKLFKEIYSDNPSRRRECLYYLALGAFRLGNYQEARQRNDDLLRIEPENTQAQGLRRLIDEKVQTEGLIGMALVGGVVAAAGVLGAILFKGASR
ncbi:mitochondrial membrane fission protein [Cladochytrium replicatum]|nr:mitochondrial membrane fission protein [Cladochytrium replicatum]